MNLEAIAYVRSPYLTKFGVPRQPGLVNAEAHLVFANDVERERAVERLAPGDRCILIWVFSHNTGEPDAWSKTVRPPLLGGTERIGVFATRSSFRPNDLALSCVTIESASEKGLCVRGCDMVDGTPVMQIMPYDDDSHRFEQASKGWRQRTSWPCMEEVVFPSDLLDRVDPRMQRGIYELLRQDPRPAYVRDRKRQREYWVAYDRYVISFACVERALVVTNVHELSDDERSYVSMTGDLPDASTLQE